MEQELEQFRQEVERLRAGRQRVPDRRVPSGGGKRYRPAEMVEHVIQAARQSPACSVSHCEWSGAVQLRAHERWPPSPLGTANIYPTSDISNSARSAPTWPRWVRASYRSSSAPMGARIVQLQLGPLVRARRSAPTRLGSARVGQLQLGSGARVRQRQLGPGGPRRSAPSPAHLGPRRSTAAWKSGSRARERARGAPRAPLQGL